MILYIAITLYLSPDHSFTFSATISVQSSSVGRLKDLCNFCGILCMGRGPYLLAERAAVHATSIISKKIWTIYLNVPVATGYCISSRCSLAGLCTCCPIPPTVPAILTAQSHKWECTVQFLHCPVVSIRTALFCLFTLSCSFHKNCTLLVYLHCPVVSIRTAVFWSVYTVL
jgi:hypothetical protein